MNQQPNRSEAGNALVAVMVSTIAISGLLYPA
jgi:preprotein translocase subunit SecE